MRTILLSVLVLIVGTSISWGLGGVKKRRLPPYAYGSVLISNFSQQAGIPPVVFDHWVHRRYYTCRVCHVDVGFGMTANSTKIRATDNMKGFFCGTCHNGRFEHEKKRVFASCAKEYSREEHKRCVKCHVAERSATREEEFFLFADRMPRETMGNGINWEKAETDRLLKLTDYIEGTSAKKAKMKVQPDFALKAKTEGMPDIIFSHNKHTVWNGCELCHPDIFIGVKKGATKYSMVELFEGKYCGVCHDKVAFPQTDCQRCHNKPPQG